MASHPLSHALLLFLLINRKESQVQQHPHASDHFTFNALLIDDGSLPDSTSSAFGARTHFRACNIIARTAALLAASKQRPTNKDARSTLRDLTFDVYYFFRGSARSKRHVFI